jgi:hypothetical protein
MFLVLAGFPLPLRAPVAGWTIPDTTHTATALRRRSADSGSAPANPGAVRWLWSDYRRSVGLLHSPSASRPRRGGCQQHYRREPVFPGLRAGLDRYGPWYRFRLRLPADKGRARNAPPRVTQLFQIGFHWIARIQSQSCSSCRKSFVPANLETAGGGGAVVARAGLGTNRSQ